MKKKVPVEKLSIHCQRVIRWCEAYNVINPMIALTELGVMRLAARINDLEKAGYSFEHEMVDSVNRFGERVRFMEYRMVS